MKIASFVTKKSRRVLQNQSKTYATLLLLLPSYFIVHRRRTLPASNEDHVLHAFIIFDWGKMQTNHFLVCTTYFNGFGWLTSVNVSSGGCVCENNNFENYLDSDLTAAA